MTKITNGPVSGVSNNEQPAQTRAAVSAPEKKAPTTAPLASGVKPAAPKPPPAKLDAGAPKAGDEAKWTSYMSTATSDAKDANDTLAQLDKDMHTDLKPHDPDAQDKVASGLHKAEGKLKTAEAKLAAAKKELKRRENDPNANLTQITLEVAALEAEVKQLKGSITRMRTSAAEKGFLPPTNATEKSEGAKSVATSSARETAKLFTSDFDAQGHVHASIKDPPMTFPPTTEWMQAKAAQQKTLEKYNSTPYGVAGHKAHTKSSIAEAKAFIASPEFKALPPDEQSAFKAKVAAHEATAQQNGWL